MSVYDLPARRRSGRGRSRLVVIVVALLVAGAALYAGRAAVAGFLGLAPQPVWADVEYLVDPGPGAVRAACVDATDSSAPTFAPDVLASIASGLAGWAGSEDGDARAGLPARPELQLVLRTVSTTSTATEGQVVLDRRVDAVPGLARQPEYESADYVTERQKWNKAAAERSTAWQKASAQAQALAVDVKNLGLKRGTTSAISGCLAAAADSTQATPDRRLLLASDLIENEPPTAGDYSGSAVLLVVSCPATDTAGCPARATGWAGRLAAEKAGPVHTVRADAAADEIEEWVKGQ